MSAVPSGFEGQLPLAARELCDAAQITEARQLLGRAVERHPPMRSAAAAALEQAEACAAERRFEKAAVRAWFAHEAAH